MKNLLKYIIPILFIMALLGANSKPDAPSGQSSSPVSIVEEVSSPESFNPSAADCVFAVSRIPSPCTVRLQGSDRRTDYTHRYIFRALKCGRAFNISVTHLIPRIFVLANTPVTKHTHKLVFLGRLII